MTNVFGLSAVYSGEETIVTVSIGLPCMNIIVMEQLLLLARVLVL